ncbi:MAG TPA: hypothetical protein DCE52_00210 [Rhodobacteraceae bacterium]|jgi:OFA family oxalate/formate antiporter-like MFS transporter|nr:hypothetical protein [Paracoccaceae bacterium]
MFTTHKLTTILFILTAAVLANGAAGLLYTWSLFIIPIEGALGLNRADLGLISSVALVSFTMGVMILPIIVYRIEKLYTAILAFALMAAGHLIFGISSSWISLILGYGLGFGVGSGLAYGFALSLASSLPAGIRALSIGLSLGAFALSGIVLPIVLGNWISTTAPGAAFMRIGIATLFVGVLCSSALVGAAGVVRISDKRALPLSRPISIDKPFLILSLILFLICFAGLAVVSQATAIATAAGITAAGYATTALTVGYLAGSLIGAPFAEQSGERNTLLLLSIFTFLGLLAIITQSQVFLYIGSILTGLTLGGVGSIMPVLLGIRYGATNISRLFGRMIIGYGLAGLIAPGIAGVLFVSAQSYTPVLVLCIAMTAFSLTAGLALRKFDI